MADAPELETLLRRPAVVSAIEELGLASIGVEDVLSALRRLGPVRIDVRDDPAWPFVCVLEPTGEDCETARGTTVLHAALACWGAALESMRDYSQRGQRDLERFLLSEGDPA